MLVLALLQLLGLSYSVARDRIELRLIEAIVAGRRKEMALEPEPEPEPEPELEP